MSWNRSIVNTLALTASLAGTVLGSPAALAQKPLIQTDEKAALGTMTTQRWNVLAKQLTDLKVIDRPIPAGDCFINPE